MSDAVESKVEAVADVLDEQRAAMGALKAAAQELAEAEAVVHAAREVFARAKTEAEEWKRPRGG